MMVVILCDWKIRNMFPEDGKKSYLIFAQLSRRVQI